MPQAHLGFHLQVRRSAVRGQLGRPVHAFGLMSSMFQLSHANCLASVQIEPLREVIARFLKLVSGFGGRCGLKPVFHRLHHFPDLALRWGPLACMWLFSTERSMETIKNLSISHRRSCAR